MTLVLFIEDNTEFSMFQQNICHMNQQSLSELCSPEIRSIRFGLRAE